jgi:hypothetical protein
LRSTMIRVPNMQLAILRSTMIRVPNMQLSLNEEPCFHRHFLDSDPNSPCNWVDLLSVIRAVAPSSGICFLHRASLPCRAATSQAGIRRRTENLSSPRDESSRLLASSQAFPGPPAPSWTGSSSPPPPSSQHQSPPAPVPSRQAHTWTWLANRSFRLVSPSMATPTTNSSMSKGRWSGHFSKSVSSSTARPSGSSLRGDPVLHRQYQLDSSPLDSCNIFAPERPADREMVEASAVMVVWDCGRTTPRATASAWRR